MLAACPRAERNIHGALSAGAYMLLSEACTREARAEGSGARGGGRERGGLGHEGGRGEEGGQHLGWIEKEVKNEGWCREVGDGDRTRTSPDISQTKR